MFKRYIPPADQPDPERQAKARRYARTQRQLFFAEMALGGLYLAALLAASRYGLLHIVIPLPPPGATVALFVLILLGYTLLSAPLSLYSGFTLPRRYGLLTQGLGSWLRDAIKGMVITLLMGGIVVGIVYWMLQRFPSVWWLLSAGFVILLGVAMTNLTPILLLPLFFKVEPLDRPELVERLTRLAERTGKRVKGVFTMNLSHKGTAANAALMGLGNTRRIVLTDTLLDAYTPEEIEVILAHELAHHVHGDVAKALLTQAVTVLAGLYIAHLVLGWGASFFDYRELSQPATLPLFGLVMGIMAVVMKTPVNALSRHTEARADAYALKLTNNPAAFITMMTKLANQNLAEERPAPWVEFFFYSHPPFYRRIAMARGHAAAHNQPQDV
ncbi:MAG: M48 family metallopeptidase [Chloroflexi bacterium]|nr:M48 family metallopeptidase [Chloroflexota bacterium]